MSNAVVWGGLALSLLVILLVAALLLKKPAKKKSAKKLKGRGKIAPQKTKTQRVIYEKAQLRKRKELSPMEDNLQRNRTMAQVMVIAKENPELASKVLRQWMGKR